MKLWEVLKALEENPNKVFRTGARNRIEHEITLEGEYYFYCRYKDGKLIEKYPEANSFNGNASINQDWQLIKQPVTWQEALEAWANYKRVYCIDLLGDKWTYDFKKTTSGNTGMVAVEDNSAVSPDEIRDGKWYIEGDK